ncbi:MAG: Nramp family divalent metal transporter [Pseudohongiellaceae bacterium]
MLQKYFGPSTLITAAFIGPGTVTVCTLAGVQSGYTLLWALLFSVIATVVLQEMTGRLGLVTGRGFGEAIRLRLTQPLTRFIGVALVLSAIVIGNAAYEGGNISGAALGLQELALAVTVSSNGFDIALAPLLIGAVAWAVLWSGRFRVIERSLLLLVAVMSAVFLSTAVLVRPDVGAILSGLFVPRATADDWLLVVALLGTTVVPYNLFLHAAVVRERYRDVGELPLLRREIVIAIVIGGVISMSIVITSAASLFGAGDIGSAADMAAQLEPLLGNWAPAFLGLGLFAAGISSAITAPLAAAYAARGILGWDEVTHRRRFRLVWQGILLLGVLVSSLGLNPVSLIQFAQMTNGILLPVVAVFLLLIMNSRALLGDYRNAPWHNGLALGVVGITILLGLRSLNMVFPFL